MTFSKNFVNFAPVFEFWLFFGFKSRFCPKNKGFQPCLLTENHLFTAHSFLLSAEKPCKKSSPEKRLLFGRG